MVVNGFEITVRLVGTAACYYVAQRGDRVFTSKNPAYVIKKAKQQAPVK